jgi:hypothetical protein
MAKNSKQQAAIAMSMKAAGKKPKMKPGGSFKPVDSSKNPGLAKLPAPVRNNMGYAEKGGTAKKTGMHKMPDGSMMKNSEMKKGGAVKKKK